MERRDLRVTTCIWRARDPRRINGRGDEWGNDLCKERKNARWNLLRMYGKKEERQGKQGEGGLQWVFHITQWQNARGTGSWSRQEVACVKAVTPPPPSPNRFLFPFGRVAVTQATRKVASEWCYIFEMRLVWEVQDSPIYQNMILWNLRCLMKVALTQMIIITKLIQINMLT